MIEKNKLKLAVLFLLLGIFVIPSSYAILKSYASSNATLTSATWDVSLNQNGIDEYLSILPDPNGTTASYIINITSQSEVDVMYSIELEGLPTGVSVKLDNGSFVTESSGTITFNNVGIIFYSDANKTKTHTLTFKASSSTPYVDESPIDINVITKQVLTN